MDEHRFYEFRVDADTLKWVRVAPRDRGFEITVRYTADVVLDEQSDVIPVAIDPQMRTDEHGLIIEWKQPMIPGWDWLTYSRKRRF